MSTIQPLFCLRMLQEKHREFGKELHVVCVDLAKAYDRVPRELIWYSLRRNGVQEAYIDIIRDMYAGCKTSVMTSAGETKEIYIEVGLHQGSAISPLLFVIILDVITEEIEEGTPWAMLFADDLVLCDPDREEEAKVQPTAMIMRRRRREWLGHVKRRDETENIRAVIEIKMEGKRPRRRPNLRWKYRLLAGWT